MVYFPTQGATPIGRAAAGVRQATQTMMARSGLHTWVQQCLTFELSENLGMMAPGSGRAIRISSKGTTVNAAQYRGRAMSLAADPLARGVNDHLAWLADKEKSQAVDTGYVLDNFYFSVEIENVDFADQANDQPFSASDWFVGDISPATKINDTVASTSTSSGFSAGFMGTVPTASVDYSSSTGREWTLPDYSLLSLAGRNSSSAPHGTWQIKRMTEHDDPQIANSSLSPDLEILFTLAPGASPRRFTIISTMMTVSFCKSEKTLSGKIEDKVNNVKRRSKGTPDRRRRGTPFSDNMMLVC